MPTDPAYPVLTMPLADRHLHRRQAMPIDHGCACLDRDGNRNAMRQLQASP